MWCHVEIRKKNVIALVKIQTDYMNRVITIARSHKYSLYFKDTYLGLGQLDPINQIISFEIEWLQGRWIFKLIGYSDT